jgi:NDP-sugar pyrophosphorylase family protein
MPPENPYQLCILAGGLATRLKSAVSDRPKILAEVADRTFLDYLLDRLENQGFHRFLFLLGHMHEMVEQYLEKTILPEKPHFEVAVSVEPEQRGTAGALKYAAEKVDPEFFMINGDVYFEFDAAGMIDLHREHEADATLAVCRVEETSRYGLIDLSPDNRIQAFREKEKSGGAGWINGGAYLLKKEVLDMMPSDRAVSIEREVFPPMIASGRKLLAAKQEGYFIDIGTPESYREFREKVAKK